MKIKIILMIIKKKYVSNLQEDPQVYDQHGTNLFFLNKEENTIIIIITNNNNNNTMRPPRKAISQHKPSV